MARQKGIIKLTGENGCLFFFKSKNGFLAREKVRFEKWSYWGVEGNDKTTKLGVT